ITGHPIPVDEAPRRPGDPPVLVAAVERAEQRLGFRARKGLGEILRSAWAWHQRNPSGYRGVE
ncbi:UDP-glucose 4-epimerase GalE, partial [Planctomycetota bacterium]